MRFSAAGIDEGAAREESGTGAGAVLTKCSRSYSVARFADSWMPCWRIGIDSNAPILIPEASGGHLIDHGQAHSGVRTALRWRSRPRDASSVSWRIPRAFSRGQATVNGRLHRALSMATQVAPGID